MKIEFINPFIRAINKAMVTMTNISPDRGDPYRKVGRSTIGDITGIIGFAEERISGSVTLSFPANTIARIYEKMTGEKVEELNSEVDDIVGELTNIVVGGAKKEFAEKGLSYNVSLPMVVSGRNHVIMHKHENPIIVIPLSFDHNDFIMEVSLKIS